MFKMSAQYNDVGKIDDNSWESTIGSELTNNDN